MRLSLQATRREEISKRHLSKRASLFALIVATLLVALLSQVSFAQARDSAQRFGTAQLGGGKRANIFVPSQSPTATPTSATTPTPTPTSAATATPTSAPAATPGATATTAPGSAGTNSSNNLLIWLLVGLLVLAILALLANSARQRSYRRPPSDIP